MLQLALVDRAEGNRTFDRCTLALELDRLKISRQDIPRWVYIAQTKSNYRTHAKSKADKNGFRHYGIFQISEEFWCNSDKGTNKPCNVDCSKLILDDLQDSLKCAYIIKDEHGWDAWSIGEIDVDDCFEIKVAGGAAGGAARGSSGGSTGGSVEHCDSVCNDGGRRRVFL